jgi:spore coat protein A, manganese oxidase
MHIHLVHVEVISRHDIKYDSNSIFRSCGPNGAVDGICLEAKNATQHDMVGGTGYRARFPANGKGYNPVSKDMGPEYSGEMGPKKDVVTALPGQVTIVRAKFDIVGKFVWHCHFISHEDHEMMREFEVRAA